MNWLGYALSFCCGVAATVNVVQIAAWRREAREWAEQERHDREFDIRIGRGRG